MNIVLQNQCGNCLLEGHLKASRKMACHVVTRYNDEYLPSKTLTSCSFGRGSTLVLLDDEQCEQDVTVTCELTIVQLSVTQHVNSQLSIKQNTCTRHQGCKRDLSLRDRDIRFLVRDETATKTFLQNLADAHYLTAVQ